MRHRASGRARGVKGVLVDLLVDTVGDGVLALIACGVAVLIGIGLVMVPWLTLAVVVPALLFAVYGCVELVRSAGRPDRKWRGVAVAAVVTAAVVGTLVVYVVAYCGCVG